VGQHQVFEGDLFDGHGCVINGLVAVHEQRGLPVGVTGLDDFGARGQAQVARPGDPVVRGE